jgi:hypothetical protein
MSFILSSFLSFLLFLLISFHLSLPFIRPFFNVRFIWPWSITATERTHICAAFRFWLLNKLVDKLNMLQTSTVTNLKKPSPLLANQVIWSVVTQTCTSTSDLITVHVSG